MKKSYIIYPQNKSVTAQMENEKVIFIII